MAGEGLGLEITELRLGLPGSGTQTPVNKNQRKRPFSEMIGDEEEEEDRRWQKKKEVVGWPPICSYRRRKMYVKVSMDGAPFVRKVDLGIHKGYSDLGMAMENLFGCSHHYVPIYEDRDGDWMLLGDVPWKMFIESCKRLRIMKSSEAKGFEIHPITTQRTTGSSN